jgi:hypothetical protein
VWHVERKKKKEARPWRLESARTPVGVLIVHAFGGRSSISPAGLAPPHCFDAPVWCTARDCSCTDFGVAHLSSMRDG